MEAADYIIDMGPGSGRYGGEVIATGTLKEIKQQKFRDRQLSALPDTRQNSLSKKNRDYSDRGR